MYRDHGYDYEEEQKLKQHIVLYMNRFFIRITHNTGAPVYLEEWRGDELPAEASEIVTATCFTVRGRKHLDNAFEQFGFVLERPGKDKNISTSAIDVWRRHRLSREARRVDFDPRHAAAPLVKSGAIFNIFRGLAFTIDTPGNAANAKPIVDHIKYIWCKGDKACADFLLNWMAHLVQRPWKKMVVTPVLKGGQGAGKGIIIQLLGKVLGPEHFLQATSLDTITGKFQEERIKTNLLTFLDECMFAGNKKESSILKGLLSEPMRRWEGKFLAPLRLKNFSNHIVASNYDSIVFVEEQDRRWFCLEVDSKYSGPQTTESKAYFDKLLAVSTADFAKYLYERDITNFRPREMPTWEYMRHQKTINFDSVMTWLERFLQTGKIVVLERQGARPEITAKLNNDKQSVIPKAYIYDNYSSFCKHDSMRYKPSVISAHFWRKIREVIKITPSRAGGTSSMIFPDLATCREQFIGFLREEDWAWEDRQSQKHGLCLDCEEVPAVSGGYCDECSKDAFL